MPLTGVANIIMKPFRGESVEETFRGSMQNVRFYSLIVPPNSEHAQQNQASASLICIPRGNDCFEKSQDITVQDDRRIAHE